MPWEHGCIVGPSQSWWGLLCRACQLAVLWPVFFFSAIWYLVFAVCPSPSLDGFPQLYPQVPHAVRGFKTSVLCSCSRIGVNPFSHCLFCVSCLTAICHMRHPYKADLGKKWRRLWCLCVRPSARTRPAKWFKTERRRRIFTFLAITLFVGLRFEFWKDWLNPQSMLIPNLFNLFWMFASKGLKSR
jgi:hypothetical protein